MTTRRVLVCARTMPDFDRESGARRLFDHIEFLREAGWSVSFVAREPPREQRYLRILQQRGVATYTGFDARLDRVIDAGRFDLALLAFWDVAETVLPVIRRRSPATRVLVDSIDLHCLRSARRMLQLDANPESQRVLTQRFAWEMVRELNAYVAADGVLTVSAKEADWINDFLGEPGLALASPDAEELPFSQWSFEERKGILFIGNFRHAPNVDAIQYLCREVVPRLDPALLAEHPLAVVGSYLDEKIVRCGRNLTGIKMIGWVPALEPYLERARITVVPLRFGAGTKRKLIQALMTGTPTVSTSIGIEGLALQHERHLLVADDAAGFARAVERLLIDAELWRRLVGHGREQVLALHGRAQVSVRFQHVVNEVLRRLAKAARDTLAMQPLDADAYAELVRRIATHARAVLPPDAKVLVASRGDDQLLALDGCAATHFPQDASGVYAGHHPADSQDAIDRLEALRTRGHGYFLLPRTAFWWLKHYPEFQRHLDNHYETLISDEDCVLFRLEPKSLPPGSVDSRADPAAPELGRARPTPAVDPARLRLNGDVQRQRVLVLGIYLADRPNTVEDIVANLASSTVHDVAQRWVALGAPPPSAAVAAVTVATIPNREPKFKILNDLLARENLQDFDYVVVCDDDILLPEGFLDMFITLQAELGFALAQPARTSNSYIDHPIVEQQQGVLARRTLFVEIGPVVSFHRSCFDLVFPFDLTSSMGWGYENVWACRLNQYQLKLGIIDVLPVDHSLRKPVTHYTRTDAHRERNRYLKMNPHYPLDHCFRVLEVINFPFATSETRLEPAVH